MGAARRKDLGGNRRSSIDGKIRQAYSGINNFAHVGRGFPGTSGTGGGGTTGVSGITFPVTPTIVDVSPGATITVDLSAVTAHHIKMTLTQNLTITLSNPPTSGTRIQTSLEFIQDATGGWTVTFPATVLSPPTVLATALARSIYDIQTIDGGSTYDIYESLITNTLAAGSGANIQLSNLGTTSINANMIPQAGKTIGSSGNEWARVHTNDLRLGTAGTVSTTDNTIIGDAGGMTANIPTGLGEVFDWQAGGVSVATLTSGGQLYASILRATTVMQLDDTTSYPGSNGAIYREGSDVKVYTGGNEINLTNVAVGTLLNTDLSNLTTTAINQDLLFNATGYDIGNSLKPVEDVFTERIRVQTGIAIASAVALYSTTGNELTLSFKTGSNLIIAENGTATGHQFTGSSATLKNVIVSNTMTYNDNAANPTFNGNIARNGADVKVYSGGALRNMSDIGVSAGGADVNLSNLTATSVNDHIIPQAGKTLGSSGNEWSRVHSNNYRLGTAGTISATDNDIAGKTTGIVFNVAASDLYDFQVAGSSVGTISSSGNMTFPNYTVSTSINLQDAVSYPGANGSIYREGNDVKVYTGGVELNLSSIGSGGADAALSNLASVAINTSLLPVTDDAIDLGSSTKQWRDLYVDGTAHIDYLSATTINGSSMVISGASLIISSNIIHIGDSTTDNIAINGRINSDIIPDANGAYDLGSVALEWNNLYLTGTGYIDTLSGVGACNTSLLPTNDTYSLGGTSNRWHEIYANDFIDMLENYTSGTAPSGETDRARIFSVNNGVKTQLRVKFQSGVSVLLAEEP